jgi:ATP-dependent metalloprotease
VDVAQGTAANPVQVTVVERVGAWVPKFLRWLVSMAFAAFCKHGQFCSKVSVLTSSSKVLLVVLSVFFENTGIMKNASTKVNEFEAPEGSKKVTFADVHGVDEAKEEVEDIIAFLKDPVSFGALGGKMTKGVLLTGYDHACVGFRV